MDINQNFVSIAKEPSNGMLRLKLFFNMEVFGNDFSDVDLREELCYHSLPKKQNSESMLIIGKVGKRESPEHCRGLL